MSRYTFPLLLVACSPNYAIVADEGGVSSAGDTVPENESDEEEEEEEEDWSMYDGAMIDIITPASGTFLPLGNVHDFVAQIVSPEGEVLDFDEIIWRSDVDDEWEIMGTEVQDDSLDVGTHTVTAVVELPNGDRLAHSIGGVLVQHEAAGTYAGDMMVSVDMDYSGTSLGASCIGGALVVIDAYGETAEGDSSCTMDMLGYFELDVHHLFEYDLGDESVEGAAMIDLFGFELPFVSEGSLVEEELSATWGGDFGGLADISGSLDVVRVTREIVEL